MQVSWIWYWIWYKTNFSFPNDGFGKTVIIFGVNTSSSVLVDNKKEDILILDKGPIQGLNDSNLTAEKIFKFAS